MIPSSTFAAMEPEMKIRLFERAVSLALAAVINLGMLGAIEYLAGQQDVSLQWAAAVMAKRG